MTVIVNALLKLNFLYAQTLILFYQAIILFIQKIIVKTRINDHRHFFSGVR
jgi:hypothetical protein